MPLQATVPALDDVEESLKPLYKQVTTKDKDGKPVQVYALDVDGVDSLPSVVALRNAHERQKAENVQLKTKLQELEEKAGTLPEGFSQEEWDRLVALDAEVKKQKDLDPEKKRQAEAEIQSIKQMHEQEKQRLKAKAEADLRAKDEMIAKIKTALRSKVIGDDITKALVESGIDKRYLKAAAALLEKSVKVNESEDGGMTAVVETDLGEAPIHEFVPQWVQNGDGKLFVPQATGSGASGSDRGKGTGALGVLDRNPWSATNWSTTNQAQIYKADQARAQRLAEAAGHKSPINARIENAKDFSKDQHGGKTMQAHADSVMRRNVMGRIAA